MSEEFVNTLTDLKKLNHKNIQFVVTRYWRESKKKPDDLDVLVRGKDFQEVIDLMVKQGYDAFSHDQALGGRVKGMQKNLVAESRVKIDLHRDFTWKKARYLNLSLIWNNLETVNIKGVSTLMPRRDIDIFIIAINTIFEKTYITYEDFKYMNKYLPDVFENEIFDEQAKKYGWFKTYSLFKKWFVNVKTKKFPIFLPIYLVLFSYAEKLIKDRKIDIVSLLYYCFFRTRFQISGVLPYE